MVDWANLTPRLQPGDWTCTAHGLITPVAGLVPHCPTCRRMALRVQAHPRWRIVYVEPTPDSCPAGHALRHVLIGWAGCACPAARTAAPGGHRWWTCCADVNGAECGQRMQWPPHDT